MENQISIPMEIHKSTTLPRPDWDSLKEEYWNYVADFLIREEAGTSDKEDILEDLKKILAEDYDTERDAFQMAKDFDDANWNVDASFVEMLGNLDSFENTSLYYDEMQKWIEATEMEPVFVEGDAFKTDRFSKLYVSDIDKTMRRYFATKEPNEKMGYWINWEDATEQPK